MGRSDQLKAAVKRKNKSARTAFIAGANWERRRWLKLGRVERPESYVKVGMRVTGKGILPRTRITGAARGPTRREIDMVHFIPPRR